MVLPDKLRYYVYICPQVLDLESQLLLSINVHSNRFQWRMKISKAESRFGELHLVALGALLRQWSMGIEDAPLVCRWLTSFWQLLSSAPRSQPIGSSDVTVILELNDKFCWLEVLVLAADRIVHSNGEELDTEMMLVSYGLRRGETFLGRYNQKCRTRRIPFYGLCNHVMLSSLAQESVVDCGIQYFRGVAQNLGLEDCDAIISYTHRDTIPFYEFASAVPHQAHSYAHCKRLISGELKQK
jgi:hypothetical protein